MRSYSNSKYLKDKKSGVAKSSRRAQSSLSLNKTQKTDKSVNYIRRMVIDSGNPRYAASKHSSFLGCLTTGQHVKNKFKVPVDAYKEIKRSRVDEELFGEEGK